MDKKIKGIKGWVRVIIFIIPWIITLGVFELIGAYFSGYDLYSKVKETPLQSMINMFFRLIGSILIIWGFIKHIDKEKLINLGFQLKNNIKDIFVGIVLGGVIMFSAYLLLLAQEEIKFVKFNINPIELLYMLLLYIMTAFLEEIVFRGYILKNLMLSMNKYLALLICSILFTLAHGFNDHVDIIPLTELFLAGFLLGITYIYTKNLWFPIALHFSWNFFQSFVGFNVSGTDSYSLIEFSITKNSIFNGGEFGFEGSILAIIASLLAVIFIDIYYRKNNSYKKQ